MLCQTNGGAVKRESIVRKSKKDILRMLSSYFLSELGVPTLHRASLPVAAGSFLTIYLSLASFLYSPGRLFPHPIRINPGAPTSHRAFLPVAAGCFLTEFAKSVQQSCTILVLFLMKSTPLRQLRYLRYLWHALSSLCKENMSSPAPTGEKASTQRRTAVFLPL